MRPVKRIKLRPGMKRIGSIYQERPDPHQDDEYRAKVEASIAKQRAKQKQEREAAA